MDAEMFIYDQVLIGRKETCGKELFESTATGKKEYNPADEDRVLKLCRYAFEYYLEWTPEQTMVNIDPNILKRLRLDGLVRQRIRFPAELEPMENLQYLVCRMYPERYRYDEKQAVEMYYDKILSMDTSRFKKGFFSGEEGQKRATICLRRCLQMVGPFENMHQIYDLFATSSAATMLQHYKIKSAYKALYELPIDYLHFSLPESERDELYYQKLRFQVKKREYEKKLKKDGAFVA